MPEQESQQFRMTDTAIGHIAQLLQVAILTGTDIIDNLRTARFTIDGTTIDISPEYSDAFQSNIQSMLEEASSSMSTHPGEDCALP